MSIDAPTFGKAKGERVDNGRMHLLLMEDDLDLGGGLQAALRLEGWTSEWLRRAADAPSSLVGTAFDAVLLDLTLPDGEGSALLARWRSAGSTVPVIVITARTALEERLRELDGGADDFLVKPFATPELLSRLRAVTRRSARQASERWCVGELVVEPRTHAVWLEGELLDLSPREFQLLVELAREPGVVVPKHTLSVRLAPLGDPVDFAAIEVHMSNLRKKIGAHRIRTLRGVGYMLVA
jgi:DNA-binding response OmpR family regulator